jgi:hypothetical protein
MKALARRSGATLTEVLMSLLVMSIGIVSVITIFPISLLRSIQATQLTNARLIRHNAEDTFRIPRREAVLNNVTYDVLNYSCLPKILPAAQTFRGTWQPGTVYQAGQIVTPTRPAGSDRPQPDCWFVAFGTGSTNDTLGFTSGTSGFIEPEWSTTDEVVDGSYVSTLNRVIWTPITPYPTPATGATALTSDPVAPSMPIQIPLTYTNFDSGTASTGTTWYSAHDYVVDPMGWNVYHSEAQNLLFGNSPASTLASPDDFGFKVDITSRVAGSITAARPTTAGTDPYLARLNGGATTIAAAQELCAGPDSWAVEYSETPVFPGTTSTLVQFAQSDLSTVNTAGFSRLVLTSLTSNQAVIRPITSALIDVANKRIGFTEPLPPSFTADGPARIETFDRRYTWMATVNKDLQGKSRVTVAVFFKRGFKPEEEHVYSASFGTFGVDPLFTNSSFTSTDQVMIRWNVGTEPPPLLKPNNFILDGRYATWYRVIAVTANSTDGNTPANYAVLTVDRPVPARAQTNFTLPTPGRAILMRGIVELFEL